MNCWPSSTKGTARRSAFEGRSSVATWLFGVAHHKAAEALRGRARLGLLRGGPDSDEAVTDASENERLWVLDALRSLDVDHREVLFLAYYADLDTREMAAVCGVPEGTIKSRLFHAKRRLAERLEPDRADSGRGIADRTGIGGDGHERT
ncbi:MAG: RNA polymerase sigma factor [Bacillota bacterium]